MIHIHTNIQSCFGWNLEILLSQVGLNFYDIFRHVEKRVEQKHVTNARKTLTRHPK